MISTFASGGQPSLHPGGQGWPPSIAFVPGSPRGVSGGDGPRGPASRPCSMCWGCWTEAGRGALLAGEDTATLPEPAPGCAAIVSASCSGRFTQVSPPHRPRERRAAADAVRRRPAERHRRSQQLLGSLGPGQPGRPQARRALRRPAPAVAIARAMAMAPRLILADRPTGSLDSPLRGR